MRRLLLAVVALGAAMAATFTTPAAAAPQGPPYEAIIGGGSSFVGLAMQQWAAYAGARGWPVTYQISNSVAGLSGYQANLNDFAATEAEFSSYGLTGSPAAVPRGYQYLPDVAGAVGILYNVDDQAGNRVTTLRLSRRTIARIFIGEISNWSDPQIAADNGGRQLPNKPIDVIYRNGTSGTTALFYDFVQHTIPAEFSAWARRNGFSTSIRIIQVDTSPDFVPKGRGLSGSDQMASAVDGEKWSISAVEAGYAAFAHVPLAFVQNQAGNYVQPFPANITQALESAGLRGDISQDLSAVYVSPAPNGYPISAYSYMTTQCAPGTGPNCRGRYPRVGKENLLADWLRYIACDGQAEMGRGLQGYAPLPPKLSQEIANSIGRLKGAAPERLTAANCGNPRFNPGYVLAGSPPAPSPIGGPIGGPGATAGGPGTGAGPGSTAATSNAAAANAAALKAAANQNDDKRAAGLAGSGAKAVGGGTDDWQKAKPVAYDHPGPAPLAKWPWVVVILVLVLPLLAGSLWAAAHRPSASRASSRGP